jgi:hypothetical protein
LAGVLTDLNEHDKKHSMH